MINLTLGDVIDVYEEKIAELKLELERTEQDEKNAASDRRRAESETRAALEVLTNTKGCRSAAHKEYASRFDSSYPYRRVHRTRHD